MSSKRRLIDAKREDIRRIVLANRGKRVYLFGSLARGDDSEASDVDLLVEFDDNGSLFDLMHIEDEVEQLLGVPVDVVSAGGLLPRDEHIRREAILI
jgi:predicted nucleotidyltransferase